MNLDMAIGVATSIKPKFGEPCNNCGWCCLTEVCPVGIELTGKTIGPCELLDQHRGKHYCRVAIHLKEELSIGTGCDAMTQTEQIFERMEKQE